MSLFFSTGILMLRTLFHTVFKKFIVLKEGRSGLQMSKYTLLPVFNWDFLLGEHKTGEESSRNQLRFSDISLPFRGIENRPETSYAHHYAHQRSTIQQLLDSYWNAIYSM